MQTTPTRKLEVDLETLLADRAKYAAAILSPLTQRGYGYDWRAFERWCAATSLQALPADPQTVTLFAVSELRRGMSIPTVRARLAAIGHQHRAHGLNPPADRALADMLVAVSRLRAERPRQMLPLTVDLVRRMSIELARIRTDVAMRNRAAIVVGLASGLRSANLAALLLEDVERYGGNLVLHVRREKQDKESKGRLIGLPRGEHAATCPVRVLDEWMEIRGRDPGPLFYRLDKSNRGRPLAAERFCLIVQRSLKLIGVDPAGYGSHSMRAGLVTEAGERGAGELAIAAQTGHRDLKVLRRYFRRQDLFRSNVAAMIGL